VPVQGLSALPAEAASQLGPLLQVIVRSIEAVLSPARVYVAQFGEEQQDLHFHVFPRTAVLTVETQHRAPFFHTVSNASAVARRIGWRFQYVNERQHHSSGPKR